MLLGCVVLGFVALLCCWVVLYWVLLRCYVVGLVAWLSFVSVVSWI